MRRLYPLLVTFLAITGCSEPPKPEKAKDLDKIQPKEEDASKKKGDQELGPIPSGPIAKVGDVEIPSSAFREIYDLKVKKYADRAREIPYSADRRYRKSIAERLIFHEILRQEADALGVELDEAALKEREEQQNKIKLIDVAYAPPFLTLQAGQAETVVLINVGALPHNFSIDALDVSVDVAAGEVKEVVITADAGEYEFYCNQPGHKEAGMTGKLTVQ